MVDKYDDINKKLQFSALRSHLDFETAVSFKTLQQSDAELRPKRSKILSL